MFEDVPVIIAQFCSDGEGSHIVPVNGKGNARLSVSDNRGVEAL